MKTIVFTQRVEVIASYNERRDCADQRISEFIAACGYLPVPLPNNASLAVQLVEALAPAGIILTGGNSLVKYGGNAPERDATDASLIDHSVRRGLPLYGFCRGMQSILDFFGNKLVDVQGHVAVRHKVQGEQGGRFVNSYHNQGCLDLESQLLTADLLSEDGVIEKISHKLLPITGTMWHPERENPFMTLDIQFVQNLIEGGKQ